MGRGVEFKHEMASAAPNPTGARAGRDDELTTVLQASVRFRRRQAFWYFAFLFSVVVVALAGAIGIVIWAVVHSENENLKRETALVARAMAQQQSQIVKDLERFAVSSANYRNIDSSYSSEWAHARLARPIGEIYNHDIVVVLNRRRRPLFAYVDGFVWLPSIYTTKLAGQLDDAVAEIQAAYRANLVSRQNYGFAFDGTPADVARSRLISLDGAPSIAAVFAIVPELDQVEVRDDDPSVIVSIRHADDALLAEIAGYAQLRDVTFSPMKPERPEKLELAAPDGAVIGYLAWAPTGGALGLLVDLAPAFVLAVLIVLAVTGLILKRAMRTTDELTYSEARARQSALHDALSGLPNRVFFDELARKKLEDAAAASTLAALIYLDIDHFKDVNDTLGHPVGDGLIREVAERLRGHVPGSDVVARISGDEFLILLTGMDSRAALLNACTNLNKRITKDLTVDNMALPTTVSMGVTFFPDHGTDLTQLLRRADIALYQAKERGRGRCILFEPQMDDTLKERRQMEKEMRRALERNEFFLRYQPIVTGDGSRIVGAEALIRWQHPKRGEVPPAAFLPVAEGTDLMWSIGAWVLRRALEDARSWPNLTIAVNVSPSQIRHPEFVPCVRRLLEELDFPANRLELEITEAAVMDHTNAVKSKLDELHGLGVRIALDDFGTGYSSLSYLRQFEFDKFKIDRSFVMNLEHEAESAAIVEALVNLADALGMAVTAEGIEATEQHDFLKDIGCEFLQGYYFGKPMLADELAALLRNDGELPRLSVKG